MPMPRKQTHMIIKVPLSLIVLLVYFLYIRVMCRSEDTFYNEGPRDEIEVVRLSCE